jgi:LPS-assembly lipoprotein
MRLLSRITLCLFIAALSACGFHLRESVQLPAALQTLSIESVDTLSPLPQELGRALLRQGVTLVESNAAKAAVLRILTDTQSTVPLSFSGAARVQEYQVVHRVEFEVVDADGKVLAARSMIERKRDYRFDETQALGAAAEDELARKELRREMLQALLRRLEALGK